MACLIEKLIIPVWCSMYKMRPLPWRHNGRDGVSNHQPHDCLVNLLFMRRSKKTSKPLVTGLCAGNSHMTGEFPAQRASNAENVSIWWRHHVWITVHLKEYTPDSSLVLYIIMVSSQPIHPYLSRQYCSGLFYWHLGNRIYDCSILIKQSWRILVNVSHEYHKNWQYDK